MKNQSLKKLISMLTPHTCAEMGAERIFQCKLMGLSAHN